MHTKIAFRYAIIVFIITVIWTMIEHYAGYNTTNHEVGQYTRMLTALVYYFFVFGAILKIRKLQNGQLSFSDGLKTGAVLSIIYSVLVTVWFAVYGEIINPQYQTTLIDFERKKMIAAGLNETIMNDKLKQVEMSSGGSVGSYLLLLIFMFLFGVVVAFISTLILKRKNKQG